VYITETLKRMEEDRTKNDRRMAEYLRELASQAPAAGSLPAEQKAFAVQLEKRQAELNKARERYAAAADVAAAEADAEVKELEAELAAVQAKADERKKQVATAARTTMTEEQQRQRTAMTDARKRELDRANKAEQQAALASRANRTALIKAEDELERLKKRAGTFGEKNQQANELKKRITALSGEVERVRLQRDASVVPLEPIEEDVVLAGLPTDRRMTYSLGAALVIALGFMPFIVAAPVHPRAGQSEGEDEDGGEFPSPEGGVADFPFGTTPIARDGDEAADLAARQMEDATERHRRDRDPNPDESPLTV
jgi:hypothetical protein